MWNGTSFLPCQQLVTTNVTSSSILGKSNTNTSFKRKRYGNRETMLFNKDTHTQKCCRLDYDWDDLQVLGQFLLLAVLKKGDYYRTFLIDVISLFFPQSGLHLQLAWEDAFVSVLRNWRTGTLFTDIQKQLKTTHLFFAPVGPQTFPKSTFMKVR